MIIMMKHGSVKQVVSLNGFSDDFNFKNTASCMNKTIFDF